MPATFLPAAGFTTRTVLGLALVAAADFLLSGDRPGIAVALFATCVAAASTMANRARPPRGLASLGLLAACLAPLVENVSDLSVSVAVLALAAFALVRTGRLATTPTRIADRLAAFLAFAPFRFAGDAVARARARGRRRGSGGLSGLVGWIVPLGMALVFVALFGIANPVIDRWLALVDPIAWLQRLEIGRILFWLLVFLAVWPFLRPRLPKGFGSPRRKSARQAAAPAAQPWAIPAASAGLLFGRPAVLRSLVLFNVLFAVETLLDAAYLWGGIALPDDLTYAAYAHRGAYPLVATALLAGAFVLVAMRPGGCAAMDARIRGLVYLWTAQNVALVASSILRLDLYVDAYSLTYWRVAAFVWMVLVAAGLVSIVARIALGRSNRWLLDANLAMLAAVLYACCFVDFAGSIADFNVGHGRQAGSEGADLDLAYLASLGPAAVPAIDRILHRVPGPPALQLDWLARQRNRLATDHRDSLRDWRVWTFRGWRLARYLDGSEASATGSPSGIGHQ